MSPDASPFAAEADGVTVRVRLTPRAPANRIAGRQTDAEGRALLKVQVTAVPENGKANAALVKLLAKTWKLPKSAVQVRAGAADRNKLLHLAGDPDRLLPFLTDWMERHHG